MNLSRREARLLGKFVVSKTAIIIASAALMVNYGVKTGLIFYITSFSLILYTIISRKNRRINN